MAKKKQKNEQESKGKYIVMANGKEYLVTGEEGKYYVCGETRFRKGNRNIVKIGER